GYMSPEQAQTETVDERSDVFSLGAVMQFVLTSNHKDETATLPRALKAICAKAMAADPTARYQSVSELTSDVSRYLEQAPVSAYQENIFDRAGRLANRHGTAIMLVLAYLLMRV